MRFSTVIMRFVRNSEFTYNAARALGEMSKANWSDFLLSVCVMKLYLRSVLLFFSNEGEF